MQRVSLVATAVCLLLSCAACRELTQNSGGKSLVTASSSSSSRGGVTTSTSFAVAETKTSVTNPLAELVGRSVSNITGGGDVDAEVDLTATAIASAIIELSLGAEVVTTVQGTGRGCGSASASISETLTVVAEAVATAFARSENAVAIAEGDAVARAIQEATITLDAEVSAQACSQEGRASAIQTLKGSKGVQAIAEAVARAYTSIAGGMGTSDTSTSSTARIQEIGTLTGENSADVQGLGSADATASAEAFICTTQQTACCNEAARFMNFCFCGSGCTVKSFPTFQDPVLTVLLSSGERRCKCT